MMYFHRFHRPLHIINPKTLNEKIMWLKLNKYCKNPLVTQCADKYLVRDYVKSVGCGDILNDLLFVWNDPEEIDWSKLPERFILKCNHGCGYNLICTEKAMLNESKSKIQLKKWKKTDYWRLYSELQYRGITKKIICEKFLGQDNCVPADYKVYCFNGRPLYILVCINRNYGKPKFYFFDKDWKFCPITHDGMNVSRNFSLPRPIWLEKMLEYSERLSRPFPFVRVDFLSTREQLTFGELTFTPSAALDTDRLPEIDMMFGDLLEI